MKLYSEEQVNELCRALRDITQWDEFLEDDWDDASNRAMDALRNFKKTTPIELPSDEEIEKVSYDQATFAPSFIAGAKWYREHLKKK